MFNKKLKDKIKQLEKEREDFWNKFHGRQRRATWIKAKNNVYLLEIKRLNAALFRKNRKIKELKEKIRGLEK